MQTAELRRLINYDHVEGVLTWLPRRASDFHNELESSAKSWNTRYAGGLALDTIVNGVARGKINGKQVLAHRAAFQIYHGYLPEIVEAKDGDLTNIKIENLVDSNHSKVALAREQRARDNA